MFYSEQKKQVNLFNRRTLLLFLLKISLFSTVGWRLYNIQILDSAKYKTMSKKNQIDLEIILPIRGKIFDRNKVLIAKNEKVKIDGQEIKNILTVNGVRFSFEDGSWGLIRASSNKPSLVIVTESPTSNERKKKIFDFIDDLLQKTGKVGEYDQKI